MPKANDANNTIRDAADSLQDYLISFTCYLTTRVEHRDIKNICEKDMCHMHAKQVAYENMRGWYFTVWKFHDFSYRSDFA